MGPVALRTDDPMVVLHESALVSAEAARIAQHRLAELELEAVAGAVETPGVRELLQVCGETGIGVAVVSNNTGPAIRSFLEARGLDVFVAHVVGRDPVDVGLLKPDPYVVNTALRLLDCAAAEAVMVGDTPADVQAARAAGTRVIGYTNRPEEVAQLAAADLVTTDMHEVASAVWAWAGEITAGGTPE